MRLANEFTLWYLLISLLVLLAGGLIIYHNIYEEIDKEEKREIKVWLDDIASRLEKGAPIARLNQDPVVIKIIDIGTPLIAFNVIDTLAMHRQLQRMERQLKGSASYKINGRHYYISTYDIIVESDDIVDAVRRSMIWIIGLLLIFTFVTGRIISYRILRPFQHTLEAIKSFRLFGKKDFGYQRTATDEFNTLNDFLRDMTKKAKEDYRSLKEFTENASHEIQTPLAIVRGKLELLMESGIDDKQATLILSAQNAVDKLSRLGQALTLLTKLNNQEFAGQEFINLSSLLRNEIIEFHDLVEMKSLTIESEIEDNVHIRLNPVLANILLNNLLSNAIRHNKENGAIQFYLKTTEFTIRNTGLPPPMPTNELFDRFKKGNQRDDSAGLGLAIVKQICDLNNFGIHYTFGEGWHNIQLVFNSRYSGS